MKIPVGILGATGMVGQNFIQFLQGHPWFEIAFLGASDRSVGKAYADAASWRLAGVTPPSVESMTVRECKPGPGVPHLVFSAMDASVATEIEQAFAQAGHTVVSNSRNHRMDSDVPLLIPEVNPDHLGILTEQKRRRAWPGQIVTNSNCSTMALALALAPFKPFGIRRVLATTMQAVSGAGYPGVASLDILGNVVPYIGGEEEKMEQETQKILGDFAGGELRALDAKVSAHCNRVPVIDGHMVATSVELNEKRTREQLIDAIESFTGLPQLRGLPSAPARPVQYMSQQDRPQPRRDAERDRGMAIYVGRLRECPVLDYKFIALGHNTIRGAAGAAVLNAELLHSEGMLNP